MCPTILTKLPMAVATTTAAVRNPQTENPLDLDLIPLPVDVQSESDTLFPFGKYWYLMPLHDDNMPDENSRKHKSFFNMIYFPQVKELSSLFCLNAMQSSRYTQYERYGTPCYF